MARVIGVWMLLSLSLPSCGHVQKAINPCQVMHTGRMTSLSLAPSHNDTTCYSLCSIRPADRPADTPADRPADRPEIGRSEVFIQWNFLDKSRVNNVMFRVLDDSEHSKLWTNVNRFSQRTLQLYNRIIQIKFNLSNIKSIKRILISVEYDGDLIMRCCDPHKTRTCGQDMTVGTTVRSTDSKRSTLSSTVQPHTLPADGSESSVPTDGLKANVGAVVAVVAVVTVAAVAFSSALFIFVFKRHRRLKAVPKVTTSNRNEGCSPGWSDGHLPGCTHGRDQTTIPRIQIIPSLHAQVEPQHPRPCHYEQVEPEETRQHPGEQCEVPGYIKQAALLAHKSYKETLIRKSKAGDEDAAMHNCAEGRENATAAAIGQLTRDDCDYNKFSAGVVGVFYGHVARNQSIAGERETVYNHPINQVTGQSVHSNGEPSTAQGADDVYDELHRGRRMVVIGNVYSTTGPRQEPGMLDSN